MGTKEKLKIAKEILATIFLSASEQSLALGVQFKYESYPVEEKDFKGWKFEVIVSEAGYPPKAVQEFRFTRPNNIDPGNMEYNVILSVLSSLTQTAMLSWLHLGKMLITDKELQEEVKGL